MMMIGFWIFLSCLLSVSHCTDQRLCCSTKTVGNWDYHLHREDVDTALHGCDGVDGGCSYLREGDHSGDEYCFAMGGDQESTCRDDGKVPIWRSSADLKCLSC